MYTYDNQHRLLNETESKADGTSAITKSYRYDLAGNLRFSVDGNGKATELTYDALNQKLTQKSTVTVNGTATVQTTSYEYNADGKLTGTTDWLGNKYENIYDSLDRLVSKKDPLGNAIEILTYDNNHRQVGSTDALNNVVTFAYDKANRLLLKTDASGYTESKTYDAAGNIASITDGNGNVTTYQYDANKRLLSVTNALLQMTSYTYDPAGNLLTQTDAKGNTATYQYNARNLPIVRIDAGGITSDGVITAARSETYQYTADGKLSGKTDRNGIVSTYDYDVHSRLLSENIGGEINTYTYDNNNNQLTMSDSTGTTTRIYDELGRVTSKTVPTVGTTTFLYDQATGLTAGYVNESYVDPKGNTVVRTKDKAGRLYQVKDGTSTTTYQYYANGNLQKLEYPNGATEEYTYYANNKLHTMVNKQGINTLEAFSYEYDGAGNMTGKADRKGTTDYTYDDLNRLLSTEEPTGKLTAYEFDAAGNRTSETVTEGSNATRTEYTYNEQNRLTATNKLVNSQESGGEEYSFDNNGNVLSVLPYTVTASAITTSALSINLSVLGNEDTTNTTGAKIYEYDVRNQMVKAVEGAYTVESEYNGDGLRVSKTVNGETSNYLYEYDKIILETDGSGTEIAQNVYGTNLISRSAGSDNLYYMYNGHGDVTSLQSASGTTAAQYYYDAFGTVTEVTGTANNPFRYAGYEFDDETDLYYLKARMYNSVTARFMQEDTYRGKANDPLSLNLYAYCVNNPLVYYDPDGHKVVGSKQKKSVLGNAGKKPQSAAQKAAAAKKAAATANATGSKPIVIESTIPDWLDWNGDGKVDSKEEMKNFDSNHNGRADWVQEDTKKDWSYDSTTGWVKPTNDVLDLPNTHSIATDAYGYPIGLIASKGRIAARSVNSILEEDYSLVGQGLSFDGSLFFVSGSVTLIWIDKSKLNDDAAEYYQYTDWSKPFVFISGGMSFEIAETFLKTVEIGNKMIETRKLKINGKVIPSESLTYLQVNIDKDYLKEEFQIFDLEGSGTELGIALNRIILATSSSQGGNIHVSKIGVTTTTFDVIYGEISATLLPKVATDQFFEGDESSGTNDPRSNYRQ